jgi:hypothetical protein
MSIGNLKTEGNKGNNFPWQLKMLLGQQCACDQLTLANQILQEIDDNTDTVEPLLAQILAAIQSGTDYEAALVVDANDVTWLEVRIWNTGTGTFDPPVYFQAGTNTPGTPLAPITYINPNTYLAQIVSNTTGLATETTLALIEAITSQMTFTGTDLDVSANVQVGGVDVSTANPVPVVLPTGTQGSRYVRTIGTGPVVIASGATEVSVMNTGSDNITVDTGLGAEILEPGITLGWRAREGRTLGAYNLAGSSAGSKYIYTAVI